jgi:hypothetical protein
VAVTSPEPTCVGGSAPRCTTGAAGWLPGGRGQPQSWAAVVKFDLKSNSNRFKTDLNHSNFDHLKNNLPELEKIELKYDFEGFQEGNNFLHRNVFRFEMYFELKIREFKVCFLL